MDGHGLAQTLSAIVTALICLAILSVVVSKRSNTVALVQDISSALAQDINAATSLGSSGGLGAVATGTWQ